MHSTIKCEEEATWRKVGGVEMWLGTKRTHGTVLGRDAVGTEKYRGPHRGLVFSPMQPPQTGDFDREGAEFCEFLQPAGIKTRSF